MVNTVPQTPIHSPVPIAIEAQGESRPERDDLTPLDLVGPTAHSDLAAANAVGVSPLQPPDTIRTSAPKSHQTVPDFVGGAGVLSNVNARLIYKAAGCDAAGVKTHTEASEQRLQSLLVPFDAAVSCGNLLFFDDNEGDDCWQTYIAASHGIVPSKVFTFGGDTLLRQEAVQIFTSAVAKTFDMPPPSVYAGSSGPVQSYSQTEGCGYIDDARRNLLILHSQDKELVQKSAGDAREVLRASLEQADHTVVVIKTSARDLVQVLQENPPLQKKITVVWTTPVERGAKGGGWSLTFNAKRDLDSSAWLLASKVNKILTGGGISHSPGLREIVDITRVKSASIGTVGIEGLETWLQDAQKGTPAFMLKKIQENFNRPQFDKWKREAEQNNAVSEGLSKEEQEKIENRLKHRAMKVKFWGAPGAAEFCTADNYANTILVPRLRNPCIQGVSAGDFVWNASEGKLIFTPDGGEGSSFLLPDVDLGPIIEAIQQCVSDRK